MTRVLYIYRDVMIRKVWLILYKSCNSNILKYRDLTMEIHSSPSIGTATLVGYGLINYRWVFSVGRFLQSAVASGTSNPQLGGMEIHCTWIVKTKVMSIMIGETWTVSKSSTKYLSTIPGSHDIKELQKTAILGTVHIFRKVLMSKYKTFIMGNNITHTIKCDHRIASTLYTTEIWFISGM